MKKVPVLLALAILTVASTSGCSRCRNLFRRGSPCGGTRLAVPPMLGGAIPLGNPVAFPQAQQIVPQNIIAQPECCEQSAPMCVPCDPCETGGYLGGQSSDGGDCGCETTQGEYFGGYEGEVPPTMIEGEMVVPDGSGTFPGPTTN